MLYQKPPCTTRRLLLLLLAQDWLLGKYIFITAEKVGVARAKGEGEKEAQKLFFECSIHLPNGYTSLEQFWQLEDKTLVWVPRKRT